jgi:flagellar motor switch protein FliM
MMSLNEVVNLQVGSQILLNVGPNAPIDMRCGELSVMTGKMGQKSGKIAIQIEDTKLDRVRR